MSFKTIVSLCLITAAFIILSGCGKDKGTQPKVDDNKLINGASYFPLNPGDTWYFTDSGQNKITRYIPASNYDTTINGRGCIKVVEDDGSGAKTEQAWSIDADSFYVHLILEKYWTNPPLVIPLDITKDVPFPYNSDAYDGVIKIATICGNLVFKGYVSKTVSAGTFDNSIELYYDDCDEVYTEWYAPGVGLLDDGNYVLDSAVIDGVTYKP